MSEENGGNSLEEFTAEDRASFQQELRKKNNEAKSLRERLAEAEAKLADVDTLRTENETLTAEVNRLTGEVTSKDLSITRLNVGIDKGLPKSLIARLTGDDEEALAADADSLLPLISGTKPAVPRADPSQGTQKAGKPSNAQLFADQLDGIL